MTPHTELTPRERWDLDCHDRTELVDGDEVEALPEMTEDETEELEEELDEDAADDDIDALLDDLDTTVTVDAITTAPTEVTPLADNFDDLDALVAESVRTADAHRRVKSLRSKIAAHKATPDDLKALAEAEFIASWMPVANALVFNQYQCPCCGARLKLFDCLMEEQQNKWNPSSRRWLRREVKHPALPVKVVLREHNTNPCAECFAEQERGNFDFEVALCAPALTWSAE